MAQLYSWWWNLMQCYSFLRQWLIFITLLHYHHNYIIDIIVLIVDLNETCHIPIKQLSIKTIVASIGTIVVSKSNLAAHFHFELLLLLFIRLLIYVYHLPSKKLAVYRKTLRFLMTLVKAILIQFCLTANNFVDSIESQYLSLTIRSIINLLLLKPLLRSVFALKYKMTRGIVRFNKLLLIILYRRLTWNYNVSYKWLKSLTNTQSTFMKL